MALRVCSGERKLVFMVERGQCCLPQTDPASVSRGLMRQITVDTPCLGNGKINFPLSGWKMYVSLSKQVSSKSLVWLTIPEVVS